MSVFVKRIKESGRERHYESCAAVFPSCSNIDEEEEEGATTEEKNLKKSFDVVEDIIRRLI